MARAITIYEALKSDHRKLEHLLDTLVQYSVSGDGDWKKTIDEIRDELIPHSRAEEALFYNGLRQMDSEGALLAHSYTEHAMAETELRTLQAMKALDVNWTTLAKKLRSDLLHHIEEEEDKVFAAAQRVFSDDEATMIAAAFEKLKPSIRDQSLMGTSLDLVENLLPRRLANVLHVGQSTSASPVQQ